MNNKRDPNIPTIFIPQGGGATVKNEDTPLTVQQGFFIQILSHGVNKGKFTETIKEIKWNWKRGWWHPCPYNFDDGLREKFAEVNN